MSDEDENMISDESEIEDDHDNDRLNNEEERNRSQALAVKNQLVVFDMLINCRIKIQKALLNCNKLPQKGDFKEFLEVGDSEIESAKNRALQEEDRLFKSLSRLNQLLEDPGSTHEIQLNDNVNKQLGDAHKKLLPNVNGVISEWWQKTSYATKSDSKALEGEPEILKNIEQILSNRERLIRKTRIQRSQYSIIGKDEPKKDELESEKDTSEMIDSEIFDDDDFYGQLLRQLIESKTTLDSVDPISLSRQWLEVQKLRKKMKRKIDTRASKGRRIRYKVHQPLISFMAPMEEGDYEETAKDTLFASIFGQRKSQET